MYLVLVLNLLIFLVIMLSRLIFLLKIFVLIVKKVRYLLIINMIIILKIELKVIIIEKFCVFGVFKKKKIIDSINVLIYIFNEEMKLVLSVVL